MTAPSSTSSQRRALLAAEAASANESLKYEKSIAQGEAELRILRAEQQAASLAAKAATFAAIDDAENNRPSTDPAQTANDHALAFLTRV